MAIPCAPSGDKQVQLRRGTTAENDAFTGADGELSFDTDQNRLRVHDGVTLGGFPIALLSDIVPGSSPPFVDTTNLIMGSADNTKLLRFEVDGFTTATVRTLTPQDANYIIAGTNITNVFSANQSINGNIALNADGSAAFGTAGLLTISSAGLITFPDDVRQIFNPGANNAGINVGATAVEPANLVNGDLWYDSATNELFAYINGSPFPLGTGSMPPFSDEFPLVRGSADDTKLLRFEVDGFTTATTRVVTVPNASFTMAGLQLNNIFTVDQAIGAAAQIVLNANGSALFASAAVVIDTSGNVNLNGGTLTIGSGAEIILRSDGSADFASGLLTIDSVGAMFFPDDVRQIFNPGATVAGLNVGSLAGDPSTPINGDLWYDSTANELTARINGVNVALGSGYAMQFFTFGVIALADSTTYYFTMTGDSAATAVTYANARVAIPKTGILRRFDLLVRISGVLGSGETVSHFIRINDTTDVGQIDCAYNVTAQNVSNSSISQAVTAGDFVAVKIVTPAWVTNPVTVRLVASIYIE